VLILIGIASVAFGLLVFWAEPIWLVGLFEWLTPNILYRVRTNRPLVALSFDDGPHPVFTPQVLALLESHDAKATFFLIADRVLRHPDLLARIKSAGHEVANHYFQNGSSLGHSDEEFLRNLEKTENAIGLTGTAKLFRPPGGIARPRQLRLAKARAYTCVLGTAYPHDPMHPPVWYMSWLIRKNLTPGTIVILHDGISDATRSIETLSQVLVEGRRRGLTFVSIGELMSSSVNGGSTVP
jgi:peptidoglycan/xylan/chitin deacetylase (PgdA/CDA1 family)